MLSWVVKFKVDGVEGASFDAIQVHALFIVDACLFQRNSPFSIQDIFKLLRLKAIFLDDSVWIVPYKLGFKKGLDLELVKGDG